MRLFYAAHLSQDNMRAYQALVDRLIDELPRTLRSVPRQTHHLTLTFLGEIAEGDVEHCLAALDALKEQEAFEYTLSTPTILKGRGRPRLIKVDVTRGSELISAIQTTLISRLGEHLNSLDTRVKPPHITLARFNRNARRGDGFRVQEALERLGDSDLPETDRFDRVQLVKSSLTPSGPIYETVGAVPLL